MSQHDFDRELQSLYQKRTQQITPPDVNLPLSRKKQKWISKPSLLMLGGLSAFGLMAVVNHYIQPSPQKINHSQTPKYVLEVTYFEEVKEESIVIPPQKPLPAKPVSTLPQSSKIEVLPPNDMVLSREVSFPQRVQEPIELSNLKPITISHLPTLKVMPKYNLYDLNGVESASVELRYQVDRAGYTHSLEIMESSVNRKLQKAAIKALSQWRYAAVDSEEHTQKHYRVVFDFTTDKE